MPLTLSHFFGISHCPGPVRLAMAFCPCFQDPVRDRGFRAAALALGKDVVHLAAGGIEFRPGLAPVAAIGS